MFIINYLLAFCLVLLSAVKTVDLFILSDHSLVKLQERFIKTTRELLISPKGNISLSAALLTVVLSLLLLFYLIKMKTEYNEALYRKNSYLCTYYMNNITKKYISEMALFNWSLRTAFLTKASLITSATSEVIWKGLVITRNILHFNYLRKLTKNKFCQLPQTLSYLKNTPYKITKIFNLETNIDETSIQREKEWVTATYLLPNAIRLKKSFCLKTIWHLQSSFSKKSSHQVEEIAVMDLSNLKCLSGPSLSPPF
jgi:hypothetical protein